MSEPTIPGNFKVIYDESIKKEGKYHYSISELRSHLAESCFDDNQTNKITVVFPDKSKKFISKKEMMKMTKTLPEKETKYLLGYHPDGFWYALYQNKLVWTNFIEGPQLNRYNALTQRTDI